MKIGIIGAGVMGQAHYSAYRAIDGCEVTAVADTNYERAKTLAGEATVFDSGFELLDHADVNAVSICTPTPSHSQLAVSAIQAGKHVLLEKPVARTIEDCQNIMQAASDSECIVMPAQVVRFFPEFMAASQALSAGAVGKPAMVRTFRGGVIPGGGDDWFADIDQSGGVLLDLLVHDFDWLLWRFGSVERVFARVSQPDWLLALVTLRFENGVIAHVEGNWQLKSGWQTGFEVAGDAGLLKYDSTTDSPTLSITLTTPEAGARSWIEAPLSSSPYLEEVRHFVNCVEAGTKPQVTLEDGIAACEIAFAAIRSANEGQPVILKEMF